MRTAVGWSVFVVVFGFMAIGILGPYLRRNTPEYPMSYATWLMHVVTLVVPIVVGVAASRLIPDRKNKTRVLTEVEELEQQVAARKAHAEERDFAGQAADVVAVFGQSGYFEERAHAFRIEHGLKDKYGTGELTITSRGVLVFGADFRPPFTGERHVSKAYIRDSDGNLTEQEAYTVPYHVPGEWSVTAYLPGPWEDYLETTYKRVREYRDQKSADDAVKSAADSERERKAKARKFLGLE